MTYEETLKAREKHRGFRYMICTRCGTRWQVSKKCPTPENRYRCVYCTYGRRK